MLMLIAGNLTAQGLTKHGEITNSSTVFIDKNGKTSSTPALNQSGAVATETGLAIGDSYGGGIVAYILQSSDPGYVSGVTKGLIVATTDQSAGIAWITGGSTQTTLNGNTLTTIGSGQANTNFMIAQSGYTGGAAKVCDDYSNDGYTDWYLPSQDELAKLYAMKVLGFGGFANDYYWSSTEHSIGTYAWLQYFADGGQHPISKAFERPVRAVRSFTIGALTSIAPISGTPNVGSVLTAGALSPSGATATYQWTICSTVGGTYSNIGTNTNKYTLVSGDENKFIKVAATGSAGCTGTVTSAALAALPSITIGGQVWMARNLDVSTYSDGTTIPNVTDPTPWANLATGAWCYYDNSSGNNATYGKLYNGYAVKDERGLAPAGWRVAGDDDWTTLATNLGGVDVAGDKMKEAGTEHWKPTNDGASNTSGFTALPGGYRTSDGSFYQIGSVGTWWSITTGGAAYDRELHYGSSSLGRLPLSNQYGFSVRCVRD